MFKNVSIKIVLLEVTTLRNVFSLRVQDLMIYDSTDRVGNSNPLQHFITLCVIVRTNI